MRKEEGVMEGVNCEVNFFMNLVNNGPFHLSKNI